MKTSGVTKLQKINKSKLRYSRVLRKNMTIAEKVLWEKLRRKHCHGLRFRRQQIIEGFIVDFYCEKLRLVIEVDGEVHNQDEQIMHDKHRKKVFTARGIREVRLNNRDVLDNIDDVLGKIIRYNSN